LVEERVTAPLNWFRCASDGGYGRFPRKITEPKSIRYVDDSIAFELIACTMVSHDGFWGKVMANRKLKKRRTKPRKKRATVSPKPPLDTTVVKPPLETTLVVADIVHTLAEKKFGAKLSKKENSRTNYNGAED
jgi:hypothetical protein